MYNKHLLSQGKGKLFSVSYSFREFAEMYNCVIY